MKLRIIASFLIVSMCATLLSGCAGSKKIKNPAISSSNTSITGVSSMATSNGGQSSTGSSKSSSLTSSKGSSSTASKVSTSTVSSSSNSQSTVTVNISQFEDSSIDDTTLLNNAVRNVSIMAAAAKAKGENIIYKLLLRDKTYNLNNTIACTDVNNVIIDGNGASLIYSAIVGGFYLNQCTNVKITNLSFDFDPMIYTQGNVTAVNGSQVTMLVDNGFPDDASWLFDGKKTVYSMIYNPATGAPKDGSSHTYAYSNIKKTATNVLTMTNTFGVSDGVEGPSVGDKITLFCWAGPATFNAQSCSEMQYTNINVYQSPGSALSESSGDGGTLLQNVKVIPGPAPKGTTTVRMMSILSDAFHFGNVKKGPTIDSCVVDASADDGVNIQGFFFHILGVNGNTITVTPKWNAPLSVGETIEFYTNDDYDSLGTAKVTAFRSYNDASKTNAIKAAYQGMDTTLGDDTLLYDITIDKPIANLKVGDHLTSLDRIGSGSIIENSTFENNRARGVVAKGHDILIENNTFSRNTSPAIEASADIYWCESGFPVNLTIRNNKISNSAVCGNMIKSAENSELGSITVSISNPSNVTGFFNNMQNKNILIENNTITNTQIFGIMTNNCDGVTIKNNTITNPFINGIFSAGKCYNITPTGGIFVGMSKNVTVTGNTVVGGGKVSQAVQIDPTCIAGTVTNTSNVLK